MELARALGPLLSRRSRASMLATCCLVAAGCGGGGGGGGGTQGVQTATVYSTSTFDGYLSPTGILNVTAALKVGDEEALGSARVFRSFVSFDLTGLPGNATIVSATLRCYQAGSDGSPYSVLGALVAIHIDVGPSLDFGEFTGGEIVTAGTLSTDAVIGWKTLDVTERVQVDWAVARPYSQFRLQFAGADNNSDGQNTGVQFESGDNSLGTGFLPELVIGYTIP